MIDVEDPWAQEKQLKWRKVELFACLSIALQRLCKVSTYIAPSSAHCDFRLDKHFAMVWQNSNQLCPSVAY